MVCRSLLFVPAEEKKLHKAYDLHPDAFIFDLEDAIKMESKNKALTLLCNFLDEFSTESVMFVRINPDRWDIEWDKLRKYDNLKFAIPKVESVDDLKPYYNYVKTKSLLAFVETPLGIVNVESIISSPLIAGIGFGAEDYCARTGIAKREQCLSYVRSKLVTYAKAFGIPIYDMVDAEYTDMKIFEHKVMDSIQMGFDGKLAIHPRQLGVIEKAFGINYEKIKKIMFDYENSESGFVIVDGEIIEQPHINAICEVLKDNL